MTRAASLSAARLIAKVWRPNASELEIRLAASIILLMAGKVSGKGGKVVHIQDYRREACK